MHETSLSLPRNIEGEEFETFRWPKNEYDLDKMKLVPCASALGSIVYTLVYTRP
jgi:hypothetical protein